MFEQLSGHGFFLSFCILLFGLFVKVHETLIIIFAKQIWVIFFTIANSPLYLSNIWFLISKQKHWKCPQLTQKEFQSELSILLNIANLYLQRTCSFSCQHIHMIEIHCYLKVQLCIFCCYAEEF